MKKQYEHPALTLIPVDAQIDTVNTSPGSGLEIGTDEGGFSEFFPVG